MYRVYAMTGSTVASALTMGSVFAPQVLLGAVAGVFADRWDRKRTMIAADVLLAAGLMPLLQRNSEDSYRGRVFGAVSALEGVTVLAGTLGAGYLSRLAGIVPVLAIQGVGYVVAGLVMLVWLRDRAGSAAGGGGAQEPRDSDRVLAGTDESLASLP